MTNAVQTLPPAANPAECASWLPREELTRLALFAYEMSRRECEPPAGHPFFEDGVSWSGRETFLEGLLDNLALLVGEYGRSVGAEVPHSPERLALLRVTWSSPRHSTQVQAP